MQDGIIIHCSASEFGSSIEIDSWHRQKGWDNIGYHFVICNGKIENNNYLECFDGAIERGRDINKYGAHAKGCNNYIGICLIGKKEFTSKQFENLKILIKALIKKYDIKEKNIMGHYNVSSKSCPNFDVEDFMKNIKNSNMQNEISISKIIERLTNLEKIVLN